MLKALANVFLIPELRNRVLFTIGMIAIYRIGFWIPLVGVDQQALKDAASKASEGSTGWGQLLDYVSIFSGGSLQQSTIFGLGIMPYITASIIFQLLQSAVPKLQQLKKEGASGQQKITEWTRYATVAMCLIQGFMWLKFLQAQGLVLPEFLTSGTVLAFYFSGVATLTAGSIFLMWLGEQIDKFGIGNGVSLILTAGIIAQMPNAVAYLVEETDLSLQASQGSIGIVGIINTKDPNPGLLDHFQGLVLGIAGWAPGSPHVHQCWTFDFILRPLLLWILEIRKREFRKRLTNLCRRQQLRVV